MKKLILFTIFIYKIINGDEKTIIIDKYENIQKI